MKVRKNTRDANKQKRQQARATKATTRGANKLAKLTAKANKKASGKKKKSGNEGRGQSSKSFGA